MKKLPLIVLVIVLVGVGFYYINVSNKTNWITGVQMDYPSDVAMTPSVEGTREGAVFTFSSSYFENSEITNATVTSYSTCGGEVPPANTVIEGLDFYKASDGLTYILPGSCNETFKLSIEPTTVDTNSVAYKQLASIFDKMVASHAKKLSLSMSKATSDILTILTPQEGDVIDGVKSLLITWKVPNQYADEEITIVQKPIGRDCLACVLGTAPASAGKFLWDFSNETTAPAGGQYKIVITNGYDSGLSGLGTPKKENYFEVESGIFSIILPSDGQIQITSPVSSATWHIGKTYQITWKLPNSIIQKNLGEVLLVKLMSENIYTPDVDIVLNSKKGIPIQEGIYEWTIPADIVPGEYRIRVEGFSLGSIFGYSEPFSIKGI